MKKHKKIFTTIVCLAAMFACSSGLSAAPDYEKAFNNIDADGSGTISHEELNKARQKWIKGQGKKNGWSEHEVEGKIAKAQKKSKKDIKSSDSDGDGELSLAEYIKMRQK